MYRNQGRRIALGTALPGTSRWVALVCLLAAAWLPLTSQAAAPFGLPLAGDPGPSTWYVSQWYGDTVWAHRNWPDLYSAGQGLHFGIDFATPCGTDAHAIGDGLVFAVDGPYGSAPHNVVIDHRNGYLSLYGHLGVRSTLVPGSTIKRGDVVGHTGDPADPGCLSAPHLHLEIRKPGMAVAVNPISLIDAAWRRATIGADTNGTQFEVRFAQPEVGLDLDVQPDVRFGGPILNNESNVWPPK